MTLIVERMLPTHIVEIGRRLQVAQSGIEPELTIGYAIDLIGAGPAFSCVGPNGPIMAAGICMQWAGTAKAWAILTKDAAPHMLTVTRAVRAFLASREEKRIDTAVRTSFAEGHRWAALLGFQREGTMRKLHGDDDYDLYSRIS